VRTVRSVPLELDAATLKKAGFHRASKLEAAAHAPGSVPQNDEAREEQACDFR